MNKTSLIIPAYHPTWALVQMTDRCVESLESDPPDQLIVNIDEHGSGYTKTVNEALETADGNILMVGNNDLTFAPGWLSGLLLPLQRGYDIATCWTSDQKVVLEDRIEDDAKFGSLFAMTRRVYDTIGGFDPQFKGYFADLDYRARALEAGFKIGKNLNCVVEHQAKATYKETDPDDTEYLRARRLYELKHGEWLSDY